MSYSSLWNGFVRFDESTIDNYEPCGALESRRLLNNLQHQADSFGRVVVASPPEDDGDGFQRENSTLTDVWTVHSLWGPFVMSVRPGKSYKIRWQLYARLTGAGSMTIYVRVVPNDSQMVAPAGGPYFFDGEHSVSSGITVNSTSGAVLTGDTEVQLTNNAVPRMMQTRSTLSEIGGEPRGLRSPEAGLAILMADTGAKLTLEVSGVYAAEVYSEAG
ncbi:MAG: hypothetical protein ACPGVG_14450 [Mycobacterium sp.]